MSTRRRLVLLVAACTTGMATTLTLGLTYTDRLSAHEGLHRVSVADEVAPIEGLRRPREATLVVIDGLGYFEAQTMRSLVGLAARGQCRKTDVGSLSLSRPVYAVLSTGLEADRSGVRFNDDPTPLAAASIWTGARAAGLSVAAASELPWWRELFPAGFDSYVIVQQTENVFQRVEPAALRLIHPLYVDEAGHTAGAASEEYRYAVDRADRELGAFLTTVDLDHDLIIVTADHGHSPGGGHGGRQDRVAHVWTCIAGRGVRHDPAPAPMRSTAIGPALALLLGLPFPADMRAGDDGLDVLWDLVDPDAFPPGHLEERRRAVERFREANAAALRARLPASDGSWDRFYAAHRARQRRAALPFAALGLLVLGLQARAHRRRRPALFGLFFVALIAAAAYALQVGLRGSFDLSAVAYREDFLAITIVIGLICALGGVGLHWLVRRDVDALLLDLAVLAILGTLASLAHPAALGWQLGFPVPPPPVFFFPYWAALFLGVQGGAGLLLAIAVAWSRPAAT